MDNRIVVKEFHDQFFTSDKGTQYRIINFMGSLKVYKRYTKQISNSEWIAGEKEIKPTMEILKKFVAEPYRR